MRAVAGTFVGGVVSGLLMLFVGLLPPLLQYGVFVAFSSSFVLLVIVASFVRCPNCASFLVYVGLRGYSYGKLDEGRVIRVSLWTLLWETLWRGLVHCRRCNARYRLR